MNTNFALYYAACAADDAYQAALESVYGKDACNARYWLAHLDPVCHAARQAKYRADDAWREEMLAPCKV